jgi:hypothetical protein
VVDLAVVLRNLPHLLLSFSDALSSAASARQTCDLILALVEDPIREESHRQ